MASFFLVRALWASSIARNEVLKITLYDTLLCHYPVHTDDIPLGSCTDGAIANPVNKSLLSLPLLQASECSLSADAEMETLSVDSFQLIYELQPSACRLDNHPVGQSSVGQSLGRHALPTRGL